MSPTTTTSETPRPALPQQSSIFTAFTLTYRVGFQAHCEKGFMHQGDLKSAIVRAREHCERMGYTFKFCRPLIVDLDEDEKNMKSPM
jgi:hypothetical protein